MLSTLSSNFVASMFELYVRVFSIELPTNVKEAGNSASMKVFVRLLDDSGECLVQHTRFSLLGCERWEQDSLRCVLTAEKRCVTLQLCTESSRVIAHYTLDWAQFFEKAATTPMNAMMLRLRPDLQRDGLEISSTPLRYQSPTSLNDEDFSPLSFSLVLRVTICAVPLYSRDPLSTSQSASPKEVLESISSSKISNMGVPPTTPLQHQLPTVSSENIRSPPTPQNVLGKSEEVYKNASCNLSFSDEDSTGGGRDSPCYFSTPKVKIGSVGDYRALTLLYSQAVETSNTSTEKHPKSDNKTNLKASLNKPMAGENPGEIADTQPSRKSDDTKNVYNSAKMRGHDTVAALLQIRDTNTTNEKSQTEVGSPRLTPDSSLASTISSPDQCVRAAVCNAEDQKKGWDGFSKDDDEGKEKEMENDPDKSFDHFLGEVDELLQEKKETENVTPEESQQSASTTFLTDGSTSCADFDAEKSFSSIQEEEQMILRALKADLENMSAIARTPLVTTSPPDIRSAKWIEGQGDAMHMRSLLYKLFRLDDDDSDESPGASFVSYSDSSESNEIDCQDQKKIYNENDECDFDESFGENNYEELTIKDLAQALGVSFAVQRGRVTSIMWSGDVETTLRASPNVPISNEICIAAIHHLARLRKICFTDSPAITGDISKILGAIVGVPAPSVLLSSSPPPTQPPPNSAVDRTLGVRFGAQVIQFSDTAITGQLSPSAFVNIEQTGRSTNNTLLELRLRHTQIYGGLRAIGQCCKTLRILDLAHTNIGRREHMVTCQEEDVCMTEEVDSTGKSKDKSSIDIRDLQGCTSLEQVWLDGCLYLTGNLEDISTSHFPSLHLLSMSNCALIRGDLGSLAVNKLIHLDLGGTRVSGNLQALLARVFESLSASLDTSSSSAFPSSTSSIRKVTGGESVLEHLDLTQAAFIKGDIGSLRSCRRLRAIGLRGTAVVGDLAELLRIDHFNDENTEQPASASAAGIQSNGVTSELEFIDVRNTAVTDRFCFRKKKNKGQANPTRLSGRSVVYFGSSGTASPAQTANSKLL